MRNEELMVVNAVTEVSSAVNSLITSYRGSRMVNRMKLRLAEDKIRACIAMQRIQVIGEVGRTNLLELHKTVNMLNDMNLQGPMADYAMRTVASMVEGLDRILEDLKNDYRQSI